MDVIRQLVMLLRIDVDRATVTGAERAMDRQRDNARRLHDAFGRVGNGLGAGLARVGAVLAGLGVARAVWDANASFETLQASLETVTGSAEAASEAFGLIERFAAQTPYDLNQVVTAFTRLKSLGLDPSEEALTSYGNTASSMGKSLMDMIEAVADATTGEFERLKEFGIRSQSEGNRVRFTFRGVTTEVGKNAAEIEAYLRRIGMVEFAGGMERQSQTLAGRMSTLLDSLAGFARDVGEAGLRDALRELIESLTAMTDGADGAAEAIGIRAAGAVRLITRALEFMHRNSGRVLAVLRILGGAAVVGGVVRLAVAIRSMGLAAWLVQGSFLAIPAAIIAGVALAVLVIDDFMAYLRGETSAIGTFIARNLDNPGLVGGIARTLNEWIEGGREQILSAIESIRESLVRLHGVWTETIQPTLADASDRIATLWSLLSGSGLVEDNPLVGFLNGLADALFRVVSAAEAVSGYGRLIYSLSTFQFGDAMAAGRSAVRGTGGAMFGADGVSVDDFIPIPGAARQADWAIDQVQRDISRENYERNRAQMSGPRMALSNPAAPQVQVGDIIINAPTAGTPAQLEGAIERGIGGGIGSALINAARRMKGGVS